MGMGNTVRHPVRFGSNAESARRKPSRYTRNDDGASVARTSLLWGVGGCRLRAGRPRCKWCRPATDLPDEAGQNSCQPPPAKIFIFSEILICRIVAFVPPLHKGRLAIAADVARNVVDGSVP